MTMQDLLDYLDAVDSFKTNTDAWGELAKEAIEKSEAIGSNPPTPPPPPPGY